MDLEAYARLQGAPWPLPEPEPGQPNLLRESLERQYAARQAAREAFGPYGAEDWT